jgi:hypothetical protein
MIDYVFTCHPKDDNDESQREDLRGPGDSVIALRIIVAVLGAALVARTVFSAVLTFMLPRAVVDTLSRPVFLDLRYLFIWASRPIRSYRSLDRLWSLYAPIGLLGLEVFWMGLVMIGFAGIFWALSGNALTALEISGSSIFTLGIASSRSAPGVFLCFLEAFVGLGLIALLISYLPTIYSAWSRREAQVARLYARAGDDPRATTLLTRYHTLDSLHRLHDVWLDWELWFTDVQESHTSLAPLVFFRSAQPEESWVNAAGVLLDTGALVHSTLELGRDPQLDVTLRAGFIALRRIAALFNVPFEPDPHYPATSVHVTRKEYDLAYDVMCEAGLPVKTDREQAWKDFAGWRVTYDGALIGLARLTAAPAANWISAGPRELLAA